jgi:hypothetical protein
MKVKWDLHKNNLVIYSTLGLETVVSGYFTEIDNFFFLTRFFLFLILFSDIEINFLKPVKFLGFIFVILSLSGIFNKYKSLEKEKFDEIASKEEIKILPPTKPILQNCENLYKYERGTCEKGNKELVLLFREDMNKYNDSLRERKDFLKQEISLTFYESLPVFFYALLISSIALFSMTCVNVIENKEEIKAKEESPSLTNLEKVAIIESRNRLEGLSQTALCLEYGISYSEFKRLRAKNKPKDKPSPGLEGLEEMTV